VVTLVRTERRPLPRFDLNPDPNNYRRQNAEWWTRTWRFNYDLVSKLDDVAGIQSYGLTSDLPVAQRHNVVILASQDSGLLPEEGKVAAVSQVVSDGYFDAVGTRLIAGRSFDRRDVSNSVPVAIVSDGLARALWPEGTPLGKHIAEPADPGREIVWREVVGVVAEIDPIFKPKGQEPRIYKPLSQSVPLANLTVVIRTATDQPELRPDIRAAILGADSTAEITRVRTMSQVLAEYLYPRRLAAAILLAAGGVGLVLAAVGLYGVVAYSAAQRLRELGIRATLGASPHDLINLLVRGAALVSGGGVALGLALAYGALRLSASMYPDLPSLDMLSFIVAPTVLGLVVLAACLIPARQVVASAPAHALRAE
jgi:hypothetical protein